MKINGSKMSFLDRIKETFSYIPMVAVGVGIFFLFLVSCKGETYDTIMPEQENQYVIFNGGQSHYEEQGNAEISEISNDVVVDLPEEYDEYDENNNGETPTDTLISPVSVGTPNALVYGVGDHFELPIRGATGWAASNLSVKVQPQIGAIQIVMLQPGQAFSILEEQGAWWLVMLSDGDTGWVQHRYTFINLPDVIPSIIYNITNAYSSVKRSNMTDIPNITGYVLYEAFGFNERLGRYEFIVPALYTTSLKIMQAQHAALEDGNSLIIYEVFRPRSTQQNVVRNLTELINTDESVYDAINNPPWSIGWFIGTTLSNHQRGVAVDMSLARIVREEIRKIGSYSFRDITEYMVFRMPTAMHELSSHAVLLSRPVNANSPDAWREVPFAESITEGVISLVQYATAGGFTPMASEWWHFNDLLGRQIAIEMNIVGEFNTGVIYSFAP